MHRNYDNAGPDIPGLKKDFSPDADTVADGAVTVGRVVNRGVVHDDQRAVAAEVQVQFAHIRAQFDGTLEGQQRVLGRVRGGAAMGDVQVVALHPQLTAE